MPRLAPTVFLLGTVSFLTDISSEMVAAVLPLYLTAQIGISLFAYGFVDGLYQGVSSAVRIAGGYAGDRWGAAKLTASIGYAISALSRIALLAASGLAAVTAVITADRLGKGLRTAPRDALIAGASHPRQLGRAFGVHRALDTAGAAIGPLLAFALLAAMPGDYRPVFVVSFAFAIIGVAVIVLLVPDQPLVARPRMSLASAGRQVARAGLGRPLAAFAVLGLLTVSDGFVYLSLQQRDDFAAAVFPLLYVGTNVGYLALALPLGKLSDRIGRVPVFLAGQVMLVGAYAAAAGPVSGLPGIIACLLFLGSFYAATDGVLAALVSATVPEQVRGSGIAAAQTVVVASRFCSSLAMGALFVAFGFRPVLLAAAVGVLLAIPAAALLLRRAERTPQDLATVQAVS